MRYLNYEFFDEFKNLDNICRDIYGKNSDGKLGVTLYLEDMEKKAAQGVYKVSEWRSDYYRLKEVRHKRNELAHERNSFSCTVCTQQDIDFIRSFRARILNQTDPLSQLRKQSAPPPRHRHYHPQNPSYSYREEQNIILRPLVFFAILAFLIFLIIYFLG